MDYSFDLVGASSEAPSLDDVRSGKNTIKRGMSGDSVTTLQKLVGLTGADADGSFGPKTDAAVKAFQKSHGLPVDGVVGKNTMSAIDASGPVTSFEDDVITVAKPAVKTTVKKIPEKVSETVKTAGDRTASLEKDVPEGTSVGVKVAAVGLGAVALGGLAYAIFGR